MKPFINKSKPFTNKSKNVTHKNNCIRFKQDEKTGDITILTNDNSFVICPTFFENILEIEEFETCIIITSLRHTITLDNCSIKLWNKFVKKVYNKSRMSTSDRSIFGDTLAKSKKPSVLDKSIYLMNCVQKELNK
jgi:hypothetical protein